MKPFVFDLETLSNCFTATFVALDNDEPIYFVIHDSRDDYDELMTFLRQDDIGLIGYNNISFDYPVLHAMLTENVRDARAIYEVVKGIIKAEYSAIAPWDVLIPQRDVFLIHHYNNRARSTSLKHLQIAMKWYDVMDMPIAHDSHIEEHQIDEILEYNLNDVLSTKLFYEKSQDEIAMRRDLGRRYGLPLMNANDAKIGETIMLKYIAEKAGVDSKLLKELRTERDMIALKDCILPYIKFVSSTFQKVLDTIKETKVVGGVLKGVFDDKVYYDGMRYDFGLGGLHAVRESSIYETGQDITIMSIDAKSYYPNLAIRNGFYPEHLGSDFCDVYEQLYDERIAAPKKSAVNAGLKLALNGAYGKSNDKYSFLYDPMYTLKVTINGQLLLAMLCEQITNAGGKVLMVNTDGIEVKVHTFTIDTIRHICKQWEEMTKIVLEEDIYSRLWVRDVNNYIAEFADKSVYTKGAYEWDGKAYHKDQSMLVVPRAVQAYFVHGTPVRDTLMTSTDIHEFCLSARSAKDANFYMQRIEPDEHGNHDLHEEKLQKTNRFVATRDGGLLIKKFSDGKETRMRSPYKFQVLNLIIDELDDPLSGEISLNYDFYEIECFKLIYAIEHKQTNLFDG